MLTYDQLRVALVSTGCNLLNPRMGTFIDGDNYLLWAWTGDILLDTWKHQSGSTDPREQSFKALIEAVMDLQFLSLIRPTDRLLGSNCLEIGLLYATFPLLEAVVRRCCRKFVSVDGEVLLRFDGFDGRNYTPLGQKGNSYCNRVEDLLKLFYEHVANRPTKGDLSRIRTHLEQFTSSNQDPFQLLGYWRNYHLHGEGSLQTICGTVLTLALVLQLFDERYAFRRRREAVLQGIDWELKLLTTASVRVVRSKYLRVRLPE